MTDVAYLPTFKPPAMSAFANKNHKDSPRGFSRRRILQLSQSKESKQIWLTSFGPKLYWGDQDMMWPPSKATLNATPTDRLVELSNAKKNFQLGTDRVNWAHFEYSCGRTSPIRDVSKPAMRIASASPRVEILANPKQPPPEYQEHRHNYLGSCGRESPIWRVNPAALNSVDRPRTAQLAEPKSPHPEYTPNREIETEITPRTLKARCSARVSRLARPKKGIEGPFNDSGSPEATIWKVSSGARASSASERVLELSKCKGFAEGYVANRNVQWPVSRASRKANGTPRLSELATPIIRDSMDHVQFNPDAFLVRQEALKARCTPRLEELAQPINR